MVTTAHCRAVPKRALWLETRATSGSTKEKEEPVLGLPKSSEFALIPPYYDRSLVRTALGYELMRRAGQFAPRTRFVELFYSQVTYHKYQPKTVNPKP